ncbi:MAG TPA: TetR/AcrR family transcriptional regulator [Bacteroidales bacterium]|jgi:AcrR family transcriptional regulator|nr:TetR/AcrR family transcriptional regulator [Bacteroidales bacterium]MDI9573755.1 TetR/AcrR family transcriptional regulator [Bacteroidota bacterium]OQC59453.1 MAG: HTH-type transcriptional repressor KstR2 [Bacteroidetes bacterium ADurb.Bin012]MBP9512137.1 TetR/AcrR family transcriptional regulator [Bacteroidales bacterium]MBP9588930.1 TetR/AcrR family transcriptional regulator [Bacteroidales bacterium]
METKKNKTRNLILKKAAEVFTAKGIQNTTIEDVTKHLGKAKSLIYYYFSDKETLYKEVLENEINSLRNKVNEKLNSTVDPISKLRMYFELRIQKTKELINLLPFKNHLDENLPFIKEMRKKYDDEETTIIKKILEEGAKRNIFYLTDLNNTTNAILTALKIAELPYLISEYIDNYDEMMDSLIDIVLYGIVKR